MSTMKERLARAAYEESHPARFGFVSWIGLTPFQQAGWYRNVDTILRELQEPSKETIEVGNTVTENAGDIWEPSAGISYDGPSCGLECWRAMLQHILDEAQEKAA